MEMDRISSIKCMPSSGAIKMGAIIRVDRSHLDEAKVPERNLLVEAKAKIMEVLGTSLSSRLCHFSPMDFRRDRLCPHQLVHRLLGFRLQPHAMLFRCLS